jgi:hypothetical protein
LYSALYLNEIVNAICHFDDGDVGEHPFWIGRFRPVVERKTDTGMAILTKILDDARAKEPARI